MTQEEKQLLIQDLCARLPYGVKVQINSGIKKVRGIKDEFIIIKERGLYGQKEYIVRIECCKPYLRPMSSMTEEEKEEFENLLEGIVDGIERWDKPDLCEEYDWLNAHHFDYRGLIEKGLALEAPEGMYNHYDEEFNDGYRNWSPRDLT
jgi:hypothetical protein